MQRLEKLKLAATVLADAAIEWVETSEHEPITEAGVTDGRR